ncbi:CWF19-like protein 2 [Dysidea avara]|uniref:CWF19-like protein 2 n=1 Tax=Dysidea avara TaxID=196820 RepID=UPI0033310FBB
MSSEQGRHVPKDEILLETREEFRKNRKRDGWRKEGDDYGAYRPGALVAKKKAKKEKKKHKKHKHSKKSRHKSDSSGESSEGEEQWAEAGQPDTSTVPSESSPVKMEEDVSIQRDSWMEMPLLSSIAGQSTSRAEIREEKELKRREEAKKAEQKPGSHVRELNPFWKDGGKGLPEERSAPEIKPKTVAGDGGKSWLRRAYKRAVEQAAEEDRSLEEVAAERWGSLDRIHSMLRAAGINPGHISDTQATSHLKTSSSERHQVVQKKSSSGGFLKPGEETSGFHLPKSHFAGVGSSTRSPQHSRGWRRKTEQAPEPDEIYDDSIAAPDSPPDRNSPMEDATMETTDYDAPPDSPEVAPVTDAELNAIGAKIMRAELMGNTAKVETLKRELETLRARKEQYSSKQREGQRGQKEGQRGQKDKVVVLTKTDRVGNVRPADFDDSSRSKSHKLRKATHSHDKKGKRERYFADDDHYSLQDLMREEMSTSAEDTQVAIAKMAGKFVRAANSDETVDDALDYVTKGKHNEEKDRQKERKFAVLESKQMTEILDNCKYCFDNSRAQKHLMIAIGINVYLAAPDYESLTEGHCLLVPMQHVVCSTALDENVWSEVEVFKKGLTRMFSDLEQDMVYIESYTDTKRKAHMMIECIPIPKEEGFMAPMYFKKAIMESDEEWAQNKKLVDTSKKGLRNSVPPGFPYFAVDFGTSGGYAHVIEDKAKFPHYFGKEIIGGMLDVETRLWRKPRRENFERQKEKVLQLSEWWKPYDWTQQLKK